MLIPADARRQLTDDARRRKAIEYFKAHPEAAKERRARRKALKAALAPATNTTPSSDKVAVKQDAEARAQAKKASQQRWRQANRGKINQYQAAWRVEKKTAQVAQVA